MVVIIGDIENRIRQVIKNRTPSFGAHEIADFDVIVSVGAKQGGRRILNSCQTAKKYGKNRHGFKS